MPTRHRLTCLALVPLLLAPAVAHWSDHPELPEWARRGIVQWGHGANINGRIKWGTGGFGVDLANARLLLDCGRTVQQTIAYLDPEAEKLARDGGLRRQPYICSQTVWWRSEYPKYPGLDHAVRLGLDGQPIIIYDNPERHCGCYNNPRWLEQMKLRIRDTLNGRGGHVDSIFFDNPLPYDCYCPYCRDGFAAFTRERLGTAMDLTRTDAPNYRFAKAWFQAESTRRFFEQVKAYLHTFDPTLTISPNWGVASPISLYLDDLGLTDMVFCENGFTLPPEDSTVLDYKLGLAGSHGLATGQLLGLSEMLRRERALALDKNNEAGILESFVYPEEHQLSLAEALATDGAYIESFALREQKITVSDAPYQLQNRRALTEGAAFERRYHDLYALAQPGASVGVVYSIWSQLAVGGWGAGPLRPAAKAFGAAGLPYEVLVEGDLTPESLRAYQVLVLPGVRSLAREDAQALAEWARAGGVLVVTGELAAADRLNRPYPAEQRPELATLPAGEEVPLGRGRVWRPAAGLDKLAPGELVRRLEGLTGGLACRVSTASPKLFANQLVTRDGRRTVHLVNSDFVYAPRPSADLRDDSGYGGARTFFAATGWRARKILLAPDPAALKGVVLRFFGNSLGSATDAFGMVVSLNGRDLATFRGTELHAAQWYQVPVPEGLLQPRNEVVFRAIGKPNGHPDWFAMKLDEQATTRRSSWSTDAGKTWHEDDLSEDRGAQTGEFLVRLGAPTDPDAVAKPEDFMGRLTVRPARDIEVRVKAEGPLRPARLLALGGGETALTPTRAGGYDVYRVPEVRIYGVLVLSQG